MSVESILESIEKLTLIEAAELVKAMEEKFGVSAAAPVAVTGGTPLKAPMPGMIAGLKVEEGAAVKKGQVVVVLEALKMENDVPAPADGVVASINVKSGDSVKTDEVLLTLN